MMKQMGTASVLFAALQVACGSDGPGSAAASDGQASTAYALMHTVSSPEGRQNYVFARPTLEVGELDNSAGLEVSGASRTFALGGSLFVADGEALSVRKFSIDDHYNLKPGAEVSFKNFGITYFDTGFTLVDEDRAWYMASDAFQVIQFDPKRMEITGTVDMSALNNSKLKAYIDGGMQVGDYVFAAVWYYSDDDPSLNVPGIKVAVISTSEMRLVKVIDDPRCSEGQVVAKLENDDLLVYGDASTGILNEFGNPRAKANCVLRIKAGKTTFDPDFYQKLDDLTAPSVAGSRFAYGGGDAIVWARDPGTFETTDDYYEKTRWTPFLVDPNTWTTQHIERPELVADGFPADTFFIDGDPHFTVHRTDGKVGGALVRYHDGELTEEVLYSEWLQAVVKVR